MALTLAVQAPAPALVTAPAASTLRLARQQQPGVSVGLSLALQFELPLPRCAASPPAPPPSSIASADTLNWTRVLRYPDPLRVRGGDRDTRCVRRDARRLARADVRRPIRPPPPPPVGVTRPCVSAPRTRARACWLSPEPLGPHACTPHTAIAECRIQFRLQVQLVIEPYQLGSMSQKFFLERR